MTNRTEKSVKIGADKRLSSKLVIYSNIANLSRSPISFSHFAWCYQHPTPNIRLAHASLALLEALDTETSGNKTSNPWKPPAQIWSSAWTPLAQSLDAYSTVSSLSSSTDPASRYACGSPDRCPTLAGNECQNSSRCV